MVRSVKHSSLFKAREKRLDLLVARKLAALGLRKTFQNRGKMFRLDLFGFAFTVGKLQEQPSNMVLRLGRQLAHGFERFFEQLGHVSKINRPGFLSQK